METVAGIILIGVIGFIIGMALSPRAHSNPRAENSWRHESDPNYREEYAAPTMGVSGCLDGCSGGARGDQSRQYQHQQAMQARFAKTHENDGKHQRNIPGRRDQEVYYPEYIPQDEGLIPVQSDSFLEKLFKIGNQ